MFIEVVKLLFSMWLVLKMVTDRVMWSTSSLCAAVHV